MTGKAHVFEPNRVEFVERLLLALGMQGDEEVTSIDLHFGVDEIVTVKIQRYLSRTEEESIVRVLEDFEVGDKLETV